MASESYAASYLKDLRTNRPNRPGGSRPLPTRNAESTSNPREDLPPRATSAMSTYGHPRMSSNTTPTEVEHPRAASSLSTHRPMSSFRGSQGSSAGRPLVQEPRVVPVRKNISPTRVYSGIPPTTSPTATYRENNQRRIEREEARSLRDALQEMDLQDEIRVHQDAQDEATELVWMHQNPGVPLKNPYAPYRNPDMNQVRNGPAEQEHVLDRRQEARSSWRNSHRLSLKGHSASKSGPDTIDPEALNHESPSHKTSGIPKKNLKVNFALPQEGNLGERSNSAYGLGLVGANNDSSKGIFRNPNDQIYEEPRDLSRNDDDERSRFSRSDSSALKTKPRNALPQGSRPLPSRFSSIPFVDKLSRFEIHKHPPTQSRNPEYKTNESPSQPTKAATQGDDQPILKDGLEIRSDDIRAATSKKRSDRSSKLPMPSAVSDRAGRPIVSFDPTWKPLEAQGPPKREHVQGSDPDPRVSRSTPPAPTIEISEAPSFPVINLPDDKEPTIAEMELSSRAPKRTPKPLSSPNSNPRCNSSFRRFIPSSQDRWMSTYSRSGVPTAKCEACSLPISGKIVTAAGTRFHPECFTCHHCQTPLECVAFYQEPDAKRNVRLADPSTEEEDHALRFYCHLDFHELFSPRCKSCKTPIEGEVVVACGAEWHVGHFFCAECGDTHLLWNGMDSLGACNATPAELLLSARVVKSTSSTTLLSPLLVANGMMSALSAMSAATGLARKADTSSEKVNPREPPKAASLEALFNWLCVKDARVYDSSRLPELNHTASKKPFGAA
ncbi:hypothetical protein ARAM_000162 [Aspergillus rambellii]|uniref:LIM zinc-binding domain-containing protein n=1 Tax=Aspergillus rambellii TaxID=308745 RepID=A0A0F8WSF4_9EURO|nr:hypothetical protein ARAM_000162 [Aspergillus rambellii]